jgi:8-oxo-dGTP diphosphatase
MIELGETIHEAARREVYEECGIEIETGTVVDAVDHIVLDKDGHIRFHYTVIYLLARLVGGVAHANSDALEIRWVTHDELKTLDMHPLARRTVQKAFEQVGQVKRIETHRFEQDR